ncbi:DUF397 domain-containing protein [Sphaerisporangium corydalis]|uniref:DUF397 domain-containing protein n=1 Tax=Sphaerisporangium corydalis TaxID=1441875 RepID=A0ABV9EJV9_9ACTN|nr:DUF397 domain-containing protein [Sphaerisporangium corydalis]
MNGSNAHLYAYDLSAATWRKSSASGAEHNCVEIANLPNGAKAVRDSKNLDREPLRFSALGWATFRQAVLSPWA